MTRMMPLLVAVLIGIAYQVFVDIYLVALPDIQKSLNMSYLAANSSLILYLGANAIFLLLAGILSEQLGRKNIIIAGLCISLVGTATILSMQHSAAFLIGRTLQGVGLSASILATPILMDNYKGKQLTYGFLCFEFFYSITPIIAPYIGATITSQYSWQHIFTILFIYQIVVLLFTLKLNKQNMDKKRLDKRRRLVIFRRILANKKFTVLTLIMALFWGEMVIAHLLSPYIFQNDFNYSTYEYGLFALTMGIFYAIAAISNLVLLKFYTEVRIISFSVWANAILAAIFLVKQLILPQSELDIGIYLCLMAIFCGLFFINAMTSSLRIFADYYSGYAAAIQGCICIGFWSLLSLICSQIQPNETVLVIILSSMAVVATTLLIKKRTIIFYAEQDRREELPC
ncbi:multidrug effflux MFS transporter [Vibrio pectenicida]|uniref:Multidrug effflux MFS transporter n=1 Tax=Vibrio pectenicida TaxID=62763 RepID=A0A7Y3ZW79_9VIBR|nr:MFS transporter [Vibrio pectenicida]NOH70256.1 multidrug effflux MFS transporter [Vibrio pectenicida]